MLERNIVTALLCVSFLLHNVSSKTVTMFYDQEITSDTCYNRYGRPHRCLPEFKNVAYQRKIKVTHTCGENGPRKFCKTSYEGCGVCDAKDPTLAHSPSYLTDLNNPSDLTCWQTDPLHNSKQNVTLILSLGKQFDITYINLEFCSFRPDVMAIYKSNDFGRSWTPYQYYADHCMHVFRKSTRGVVSHGNEVEALCTDAHLLRPLRGGRIAFSTLEGRPSAPNIDANELLQEWVTATDIKVVFMKISGNRRHSGTNKDMLYYGVSDFSVGGRCRCNGHASKCVKNPQGKLVCDCKHHTSGVNCEKCSTFYQDRPWMRATANDANECIACNCSNHAKHCRFNAELYRLEGHGGECINCRHNTAGRFCHYCKQGYYRDKGKDMTHRKACIRCNCHPVGSRGKICDQATGQCPCKEGVTGRTCNECKPGFRKTKTKAAPCVDKRGKDQPRKDTRNTDCKKCRPLLLSVTKYCKRDFGIRVLIIARAHIKDWMKFTVEIQEVFKWTGGNRLRVGKKEIWVRTRDVKCSCPKFRLNRRYLIVGFNDSDEVQKVVVNRRTVVTQWSATIARRVAKFQKRQKKGVCLSTNVEENF